MSGYDCIPSPPRPSLLQMNNLSEDTGHRTTPNISSRISVCDQGLLDHSLQFLWEETTKGDKQSSPSVRNQIDQGFLDIVSRQRRKEQINFFNSSHEGIVINSHENQSSFSHKKYLPTRRKIFYLMLAVLTLTVMFSRFSINHLDIDGNDNLSLESDDNFVNSSSKCFEARCIEIKRRIVREGVSTDEAFNLTRSSQHLSLTWIARNDKMKLNVEDDRLISRYALAVFFFATNEDVNSTSDYHWDDTNTWLSKEDVCQWKGVTCERSHITHFNVSNHYQALSGNLVRELFLIMVRQSDIKRSRNS